MSNSLEGMQAEIERRKQGTGCSCARYDDGSVSSMLCPSHAKQDPCLTASQVTGKRRKGTITRGTCTNCGYKEKD